MCMGGFGFGVDYFVLYVMYLVCLFGRCILECVDVVLVFVIVVVGDYIECIIFDGYVGEGIVGNVFLGGIWYQFVVVCC